jgi:Hemerythrin HHE cation binding domain
MAEPLDAIKAFHNAFRLDMTRIDASALESARKGKELSSTIERFRFFNEILVWHAHGEELAVFPAVEVVAPSVSEAYERDHRGLDAAFDALNTAVSKNDVLATARATAAFKFHLDIHLGKEDAHLYRLVRERVSMSDQGKAVGIMSNEIPQERFPEVVGWLYPLLDHNDRENMTRIWQMVMPPPVFDQAKQLIKKAIGDGWAELIRRIPALT